MTCPNCKELVEALQRMCRSFPMEEDMLDLDWSAIQIDQACADYDHARALIAKARREPPPITA